MHSKKGANLKYISQNKNSIHLDENEELKSQQQSIKENGYNKNAFKLYDQRNNVNIRGARKNIFETSKIINKKTKREEKPNQTTFKNEKTQKRKENVLSFIGKGKDYKNKNISQNSNIDFSIISQNSNIFKKGKTIFSKNSFLNILSKPKETNKFENSKTQFSSKNSFLIQNEPKKANNQTFISPNDSFCISRNKKKLSILEIDNRINISINESLVTQEESLNASKSSIISETTNIIELPNRPKGLSNFSLNCYMNSLLQCFYHIKGLRTNFIDPSKFSTETQKVCHALSEVMNGLTYGEKSYFSPNNFKTTLGNVNRLFEGCKGADVSDLYRTVVDSIINEIPYEYPEDEDDDDDGDNTNQKKSYENAKKEVDLTNPIIQDLNYFYETVYDCPEGIKCYSIQNDTSIMFELLKISKLKSDNINLYDCFDYNFRIVEKNGFYCSNCKCSHENTSIDKFVTLPKVLCLILNRGKGKQFTDKVEFYETINIKKYVDNTFIKDKQYDYKLIGVSTHLGSSSNSGHYIAYCYRPNENKYFCFNDESCRIVDFEETKYGEPYILFYEHINSKNKKTSLNDISKIKKL